MRHHQKAGWTAAIGLAISLAVAPFGWGKEIKDGGIKFVQAAILSIWILAPPIWFWYEYFFIWRKLNAKAEELAEAENELAELEELVEPAEVIEADLSKAQELAQDLGRVPTFEQAEDLAEAEEPEVQKLVESPELSDADLAKAQDLSEDLEKLPTFEEFKYMQEISSRIWIAASSVLLLLYFWKDIHR